MTFSYLNYESSGKTITKLAQQLARIDPDIGYCDWIQALMVIFNETRGSEEGFELADDWSSAGAKYRGTKDIRSKWRHFKLDHPNPVRFASLIRIAQRN
jgi:hypothetical protein